MSQSQEPDITVSKSLGRDEIRELIWETVTEVLQSTSLPAGTVPPSGTADGAPPGREASGEYTKAAWAKGEG